MHYLIEQTAGPGDATRAARQVRKWRQNDTIDRESA